jgi:phage terminase Nu1 subunit (DNA packaging protein)
LATGDFYETVVAGHAASLSSEKSRRQLEEARAAAATAELAAVRAELQELRSSATVASKQPSKYSPPLASRSPTIHAPVPPPEGGVGRDEIEYLRLHYENEMALAAERAALAQVSALLTL